jgi:hypothetical protein
MTPASMQPVPELLVSTIKIWDGITGLLLNTVDCVPRKVRSVKWSPDDSEIVFHFGTNVVHRWCLL